MADITLQNYKKAPLYPKVVMAVGLLLQEKDEFSTVDVLIKMGNLTLKDFKSWERGEIDYLDQIQPYNFPCRIYIELYFRPY